MQYTVKNGAILSQNGMPWGSRWFCDDRLAFQMTDEGIEEIDYWGKNTPGGAGYIAFRKRFWGGLQLYTRTAEGRRLLKPEHCRILPYGCSGNAQNAEFSVFAANNSIYFKVKCNDDAKVDLEFYDEFRFHPGQSDHCDVRYAGAPRIWQPFVFEANCLRGAFESGEKTTNLCFSCNAELSYTCTPRFPKHVLTAGVKAGEDLIFCLSFSEEQPLDWTTCAQAEAYQKNRYDAVAAKAPKLHSGSVQLDNFFALAPMYCESLKILDLYGMIRARTTRYWAWGWDTMTSNNCLAYWGDEEFLGHMLTQLRRYAKPGKGIAHSFTLDMLGGEAAPPPAQGMYLTVLDLYRQTGGDVSAHYDFAMELFDIILATEKDNSGLCEGFSLYPDFRDLIRETNNDISAFNNTVAYCAARSMERIAFDMEDEPTRQKAAAFADRLLAAFQKVLYNPELGFIDSSVEADSLEKRNLGSNNAVKWESNDCADLLAGLEDACLDFYEKNLVCKAGLRPVPEWDPSYDTDGNQLHCWWPVMSEFYTRLANRADRDDLLRQYAGWIEYWTERLTCPEGISCYCNDEHVPFDNWNSLCGVWHGYSVRGFYNAIVHSFVGVDIDHKGLNIYPRTGPELSLEGLHFGEKTFHIVMSGSGSAIGNVWLNGIPLGAVESIPLCRLGKENTILVERIPNA